MANRWGIPAWLEREVQARDLACVYCRSPFGGPDSTRRSRRSWEHIVNDVRITTSANIALCCIGCNASKGTKDLEDWLLSRYCMERKISAASVAPVVQQAIVRRPSIADLPS